MLNLKKTAVAVLALGSSAVFAGTMGPVCAPGAVTVPCEKQAWDFGVQALYLKPSYNLTHSYVGTVTNGTATTYVDADPKWGWGFKLEGSYHFNTGNDVNVNWYHMNKTSNHAFVGSPLVGTAGTYAYQVKPSWDAVNFEFGQHVDFGDYKNIRFHGGAQYVHLEHEARTVQAGVVGYSAYESTFSGFGPRIGADMSYDFGGGFAVYGNSATSLLIGSSKFNNSAVSANPTTYVNGSHTDVVPELEAKLGAMYTYAMAQGDLTLDAGYMWVNYFDAQQNFIGTPASASSTDVAFSGPYLGLKWVGNM